MTYNALLATEDQVKDRVVRATVKILKKGGQGIIVPGGYILTAAHCLEWSAEGDMALGDYFVEPVECNGEQIQTEVLAVEPVSDIAVLGCPDGQTFWDEANRFQTVVEAVEPIPISQAEPEPFQPFSVLIRTHKSGWIAAQAQLCYPRARNLALVTESWIEGGTSGGPVVDSQGRLVGVVSVAGWGTDATSERLSSIPRPHWTLPHWVLEEIRRSSE